MMEKTILLKCTSEGGGLGNLRNSDCYCVAINYNEFWENQGTIRRINDQKCAGQHAGVARPSIYDLNSNVTDLALACS
jgi:hypothetical protein